MTAADRSEPLDRGKLTPFISYAREDRELAQRLYRDLKAAGFSPWIDAEDLKPGQNWRLGISAAIRDCDSFLALLSSQATSKRGYVQKELLEALDVLGEYPPDEIFLIPVRLDECQPKHPQIADLQWVDLFPSYERGFRRLVTALKDSKRGRQAGSRAAALRDCERLLETARDILELSMRRSVFNRSEHKGHLTAGAREATDQLEASVDRFDKIKDRLDLSGSEDLREALNGIAAFVTKTRAFGLASVVQDTREQLQEAYTEYVQIVRPRFLAAAKRDFGYSELQGGLDAHALRDGEVR